MVDSLLPEITTPLEFNPFEGPEIGRLTTTTEPQMEIWMACALGGEDANRAYNESVSLRFQGVPERAALEKSVRELIRRHESLRSAFSADGRQMIIFRDLPVQVQFEDYSVKPPTEQAQAVAHYLRQEAEYCFDLLHGPLFKAALLMVSADDSYLILTAHHIICDGWSMGILMQDLGTLYSANVQNQFVNLPEPVLFGEFAEAQISFEQSPQYAQIQKFWLDLYKQGVPVVDVPTDFPRPRVRTYKSHRLDFDLDETLVSALKNRGREAGCSFVTTLVTIFDVWLHRLTGQDTISIGLPAAGQSVTGDYRLVGHCVNLLPLRSHLPEGIRFIDFLKQRKSELIDAYDHQRLTFGSLLKKLAIARESSRIPLVPVIFNVDMGLSDGVSFHGLTYQLMSNPRAYENFELFVNASGSEKSLTLEWSYNTQLFKPETIRAMMAGFENLLREVIANPLISVNTLQWSVTNKPVEAPAQQEPIPASPQQPLHRLLAQTAAQFPEKTALEFQHQKLTYRYLHETANQLATYFIKQGIQRGDIVGVALDRSPEMLISLLAILKAGAAYLPLDPSYPHDRIAYMLTDSSARMVITSQKYAGRLNMSVVEIEVEKALAESSRLNISEPAIAAGSNDLAYILYTSGSTGRPKGVLIEHHNVVNLLTSIIDWPGITPGDRLLGVTTISFDIAVLELFLPLLVGATLVLADTETTRDGRLLLEIIKKEKISIIQATPATYKMMLAAGWDTPLPLKVLCCGEPLAKDLAQKLMARCASLWNMYGPTETTIYSTGKQILPSDNLITIGRPIHNTQVYILDDAGNQLGIGSVGEITIAGAGVARGYHNRPELNTEKFVKNQFGDGLLYRTGDLGKWTATGEIHCLGRIDQQVKIRGYRIELGEIDHALLKSSDIKDAVVVAREDRPGYPHLVAYVVPKTTPGEREFSEWRKRWKQQVKDFLPDYMVPSEFVLLPQLPLTPNGKIDRKALPKPENESQLAAPVVVRPQTKEEELVAAIWSDVLGLETINDTDDFFELGGHSLIAVQVMTRIEQETGKRLPLSTLFEYPTISKLAALLQTDKKATSWKSLVPIKPTGNKMPIYFVHGDGLNVLNFNSVANKMDSDQPVYGFQALGLDGQDEPLDNMEDMAAFYVSELLEQNPTGPYALAGYSFGGYIAVEMARILYAMDKEIRLLGILDTDTEIVTSHLLDASNLYKRIRRQFPKLIWVIRSFIHDPAHTIAYQKKFYRRKITEILEAIGLREKSKPDDMLYYLAPIKANLEKAYEKHIIRPFDGHVTLFRARKRSYFVMDFAFLGWKKYALKGVTVYEVPGNHNTMFHAPNDQETARIIQAALNESEKVSEK
ncbi:amino acid adenylation domain-containing protein [Salmonirosea aquatica]|uniref:Amino acid adenylation domain-containing protein n=1 Tax=Salmonirosea aquatica TaxID=2654236 RepID=A0A7C9BIH1_9BACT|nr:amino acid adenylation domain-containing protein [Cytophagaceae bacterium SJW1-29]